MAGICTEVIFHMVDLTRFRFKRYNGTTPWRQDCCLLLTRVGVPVSTSFLVLSAFASTFVLEKMLMKSMMGYAVAAVAAYVIWIGVTKILDEAKPVKEEHKRYWRIGQWFTTGFLWWTWLSHDMANIAVFLPREIPVDLMILISIIFVAGLWYMFREGGGKIQNIVLEKHNTRYVRSATIIDGVYWIILFFFKELNDIPNVNNMGFCWTSLWS